MRSVWNAYLASKEGKFSSRAGSPSPYWIEGEQRRWPLYDLADFYIADGAVAEIIGIDREQLPDPLGGSAFRIRTRFTPSSAANSSGVMTTTVYARRENGQWRLANALPINTRGWRRTTVGTITYVYPPNYAYSAERASRAMAFADSVSKAFQLPPLPPLTYYLAPTLDEAYRIIGVEPSEKYGPSGGFSQPINAQLFSGIPAIGENYRHELVHFLFAPLCCDRTSYFVSEGVPTWLGGTSGDDFKGAVGKLRTFLLAHPTVTLDSLFGGQLRPTESYPAAAVLVAMVADRDGASGVRKLFTAGGTSAELRTHLEAVFAMPWTAINAAWRDAVLKR